MLTGVSSQYGVLQTDLVNLLLSARTIAAHNVHSDFSGEIKEPFNGFYDAKKVADSKKIVDLFLQKRLMVVKGAELKKARFVTSDHIECTTQDFMEYFKGLFEQKADAFEKMIRLQALIVNAVEVVINGLVVMLAEEQNFAGAKAQLIYRLNSDEFAELNQNAPLSHTKPYQSCFKKLMDRVVSLQPLNGGVDDLHFAKYVLHCVRLIREKLSLENNASCLCYVVTNYNDVSQSAAAKKLNNFKPTRMLFIDCGYSVSKFQQALSRFVDQANSIHQAKYIHFVEMNKMLALMYAFIDKAIGLLLSEHNKSAPMLLAEMEAYRQEISALSSNQCWQDFMKDIHKANKCNLELFCKDHISS